MRGAYNLPETLIFGGPKWVNDERYDIDAKAAGPAGDHEIMIMLQALLAERFQLESRKVPTEVLVIDRADKATEN